MNQYWNYLIIRLAVVALAGITLLPAVYAVDDDYYLPYTDTYGYTYDAKTGTYVKQDGATNTAPTTTTTTPTETATQNQTTADMASTTQNTTSTEPDAPTKFSGMNTVYLGLLLLAGVIVGYWLISRKKGAAIN